MKPDTGGTNIGPALSLVSRLFGAKRRSRTALFILTQSALSGNVNGLYGVIRSLRVRGTKVYSIGIGSGFSMAQVQGLAGNDRNSYLMSTVSQVPGSLMSLQYYLLRSK